MAPRASIRRANPEDWDAIAALLSASNLPLDGARDAVVGFVVAEHDRAIVGCAAIERYGGVGLLRSVAVAPAERGSGVGIALVERCLADAREASLSALVLLTTTAERFFPRFGFERIDRSEVPDALRASPELRDACPASAVVMKLSL